MMIDASEIKNGLTLLIEGNIYQVVEFLHVKPGKGAAILKTKLKNLRTTNTLERTFNANTKFETATITKRNVQYSYNAGGTYSFMDLETYETYDLSEEQVGYNKNFLVEGMEVIIVMYESELLGLNLPDKVELTVTQTDPAVRGNTVNNALKDILGFKVGWATPWICCILGLVSGVAIGMITEFYTSADFKPTRTVAEYAVEGEAFVVTKGDAVGSKSVMLPVAIIGISLVISASIGGTYGIAIAALGMLSFVATTVSIDAFGPIADNAGGLAESCHLDPQVRKITDKLDSVGNTTAAVGKGFAIGSAAFATVSLICAYVSNLKVVPTIDSFMVIAGCIIGGALIEFFIALLTDNTIASAKELADVGDRQLSDPAILAGEKDPDYNELVALATKTALKRMLVPSVIALAVPFVCGAILGPEFVIGILLGATVVAIPRAIFMGNSGGTFDNAKKYIESGAIEGHGKGSAAHKAAVTGDTIGDTRKDVVGVALDIFIKMMSTVATTLFVVITALYSLIQNLF